VLKSKQPLPFDAPKKEAVRRRGDADLAADELEIDDEPEENPDDEVDIGGDDDIGVPARATRTKKSDCLSRRTGEAIDQQSCLASAA
jgi:hypothetical protein